MYRAQYFDEVATDVQKVKEWYKEQQEGLDERFAQAVEECILSLANADGLFCAVSKHPHRTPENLSRQYSLLH